MATKAAKDGRDLIVHSKHYDGQKYHYNKYRVTNLEIENNGRVTGITEDGELWKATGELCEYAISGTI